MPIQLECTDNAIYHARWSGRVTLEEVLRGMHEISADIAPHREHPAVIIADLTHVQDIPADVAQLAEYGDVDADIVGFVALRAYTMTPIVNRMVARLPTCTCEFVNTPAEALDAAERILARRS